MGVGWLSREKLAAGFVLGTIRTLLVVPRLGARAAELIEQPIVLGVSILAARSVVGRVRVPPLWQRRLAMGCIALGLMLLVEFTACSGFGADDSRLP